MSYIQIDGQSQKENEGVSLIFQSIVNPKRKKKALVLYSNPGRAPILRTKSVTKKETNKCMAEIYDPGGIQTRAAQFISQYHNH